MPILVTNGRNAATRKRTRQIYLYCNTAYGFWSKRPMRFDRPNCPINPDRGRTGTPPLVYAVFYNCLRGLHLLRVYVSCGKVPRLVFRENGYSDRVRRLGQIGMPNDPPWGKLVVSYIVASVVVIPLVVLFPLVVAGFLAHGLLRLRHIFFGVATCMPLTPGRLRALEHAAHPPLL
jgi:hypothetical protein